VPVDNFALAQPATASVANAQAREMGHGVWRNAIAAGNGTRLVTPLQSAVLDTAALLGWDSRTGLRLDELQSQPSEFAGVGRADRSDSNHRVARLACSRGLDLQFDDCWDGPLMLEIAGQHLCHGWEPPLSLGTHIIVCRCQVLPGKLWH
jgi:hypothetical protein